MSQPEAVVFDLNGVFLQSQPLSQRVSDRFGIDKDLFFSQLKTILKEARTPGQKPETLWNPVLIMLNLSEADFFDFWFSGETLVPELVDYARQLKASGMKIFILSNNFSERTKYYRQNFPELFALFDGVYFSWETGFVKPDKQAYLKLLQDHNLNPADCVYFDDSPENVEAANNLGIKSFLYQGLSPTRQTIDNL